MPDATSDVQSDGYVTKATWTSAPGRPDAIDDIADQFERPAPAEVRATRTEWPRRSRGWRSIDRMHPETGARLAG